MAIDLSRRNPESWTESQSNSSSTTNQSSETHKTLDPKLVEQIMSGLAPQMTDEQIASFAENLLRPVLNAGLEASQQQYEQTKMAKEQEIENLAATLARSIQEQQGAYRQSAASVETGALARGMGRSSYTMQTIGQLGAALGENVARLTEDSARQQSQIAQQITQAAQQHAQTSGRLNTDYAANLAAKIQELKQSQQAQYNQNYMTAVSGTLGSKSENVSKTEGSDSGLNVTGKFEGEENGGGEKKLSGGVWKTYKA